MTTTTGCRPASSSSNGVINAKLLTDIQTINATIAGLQEAFDEAGSLTQTQVDQLVHVAQAARASLVAISVHLVGDDQVSGTASNLNQAVDDLINSIDPFVSAAGVQNAALHSSQPSFRTAASEWDNALTVLYGRSSHPAQTIPMTFHGL